MVALPVSPRKLHWYLVHKSIGVTVFLLTSLRLAWRAMRPHPAPVPMPSWQRRSAAVSHVLLYVLLFAIPLSGWVYSSSTGVQVVYAGLVPLPDLVARDRALADVLRLVHVSLNTLLFFVICVHVAAAVKHHLIDRDAALARMLQARQAERCGSLMIMRTIAAGIACALMLALPYAHGQGVVAAKSEIGFTVKQMGVKFDGRF